jgi:diacylglycerol kinase (ATP)
LSHARIIVNPVAGAGRTAREWPRIRELLRGQGLRFEHDQTEAPGHAIELAEEATKKGYETIISVGGDGTIHEIVNGMYHGGGNVDISLGIVCTGTGSDYARTFGISRCWEEACQRLIEPGRLKVDLGAIEYSDNGHRVERVFANFAGMGFDAEIVRRTSLTFKSLGSTLSYLLGVFTTLVSYRNREIELIIDGEETVQKVCAVVVNNGKYGGGGMFIAPDANPSDGWLDLMIIGDIGKADLLRSLPLVYKGKHGKHRKVHLRKAREVEIRSDLPLSLQADGELLGRLPVRFRIIPAALNLIV